MFENFKQARARASLAALIPVVFLLAAPASAVAFRPATSFERSWMKRSIETWMRSYGGFSGCRLIEQRVSTVEREWASAWVGGHCGHGSDDIHGDLVIFHHNGQDRPGVWRVKGVYSDPSVCGQVPTRALVDLGAISKGYAPTCESEYRKQGAPGQHKSEQGTSEQNKSEVEAAKGTCLEDTWGVEPAHLVIEWHGEKGEYVRNAKGQFLCEDEGGQTWVSG